MIHSLINKNDRENQEGVGTEVVSDWADKVKETTKGT